MTELPELHHDELCDNQDESDFPSPDHGWCVDVEECPNDSGECCLCTHLYHEER